MSLRCLLSSSFFFPYLKTTSPREYEDMRSLFNQIFKYAIASGVLTYNPVGLIPFKRAERENRDSLSRKEISSFLERIKGEKYDRVRQGAYIMYFFGLRPCEIDKNDPPKREGDFLIARNRKRKNGKVEYKKIPISKGAEALIDWNSPLTFGASQKVCERLIKDLLEGENTSYNLRHTFNTICREKVREDIVEIWMGDSPQRLIGKVYTHFSDEFMAGEMAKVEFPLE